MTQATTTSPSEPVLIKSESSFESENDKRWNEGIRLNEHTEYELYYLQHNIRHCGFKIKTGDETDEDEIECAFADLVGAYMYFSAKHKKEHVAKGSEKSFIGDCNTCIQDFLSAADAGLSDAAIIFERLIVQNGWKQLNKRRLEHAAGEEQSRLEFLWERKTRNGLSQETSSAPNTPTKSSPTSPPLEHTQPTQEHNRFHSPQRRNPPSIILTEVKDSELLSGDKKSLHRKWDEWCAAAFDQHELPQKFHSSNISIIKRQGRRSICLSFHERPKRYLIDYFLHRMKETSHAFLGSTTRIICHATQVAATPTHQSRNHHDHTTTATNISLLPRGGTHINDLSDNRNQSYVTSRRFTSIHDHRHHISRLHSIQHLQDTHHFHLTGKGNNTINMIGCLAWKNNLNRFLIFCHK